MSKYFIQRVLIAIPTFFAITFIVYALYALSPGDPLLNIIGQEAMLHMSDAQIEQVRHQYGLDQPVVNRYVTWLGSIQVILGYLIKGKALWWTSERAAFHRLCC